MGTVRKTLYGDDIRPLYLARQGKAGQFWYAIDHHGATSTGPEVASTFDTECPNLVPQDIQEDSIARCKHFHRLPVDVG